MRLLMVKSIVIPDKYKAKICERSFFYYFLGLIHRFFLYTKYSLFRYIARFHGAKIGANSIICYKLAKKANSNLEIGNDTIIETSNIDLRNKITIGNHCIINRDVEIIRLSHDVDNSRLFETKKYPHLYVSDYCWLATGCKILPSATCLAKGSIIGAYSVLVSDTDEMGIYSGFPAIQLKKRLAIHDQLIVVSLKGGDLIYYMKARYAK